VRRRTIGLAITLSSVTLVAIGATTAAMYPRMTNAAALPGRTTYVGSSNGPLQVVQNASTAANAAAIQGYVNNTLGGIGFIGTGTSKTLRQYGIYGTSYGPNGAGIYGRNYYPEPAGGPTAATQTIGVYGISSNGNGIIGLTAVQHSPTIGGFAGVMGSDTSSNSGYNDGVLGTTTNGNFGIEGVGGSGSVGGAAGIADNGNYGVYGQSASNTGVVGVGGNEGVAGASGGYPLIAFDSTGTNVVWSVDAGGTVTTTGAQQQIAASRGNTVSRAFVPSATTPLLEDTGTATLVRGAGTVRLDPAFGASINNAVYQVFITPDGQSNGLYVSQKSATEFVVRENNGGHASIDFDYRIVAKPYASTGKRIAIARTAAELGLPGAHVSSLGNAKAAKLFNTATLHKSTEAILQSARSSMPAAPRVLGAPESR
jgi:hypothetical protein